MSNGGKAQALLLSGRHTGLYNYIHTKVGSFLCYCLCALTEIGSPMISRVNNDVTGGVDHWSLVNPNVTSQEKKAARCCRFESPSDRHLIGQFLHHVISGNIKRRPRYMNYYNNTINCLP